MAGKLGAESTADEVLEGIDLTGKRILVTGVSAGIGVETVRALVAHGADVVGTARDLEKARSACGEVRAAAAGNGGSFELVELDLASLASVRACADGLVADGRPFDIVIANAGLITLSLSRTADGFETQFGTNHLGHFVLVNRIAPLIGAGGRVVNLSSAAHRASDIDLDDPNFDRTPYDSHVSYGRSKTANVLFTVEFDRRHRDRGVRAVAVHPGPIGATELSREMDPALRKARTEKINEDLRKAGKPPMVSKTIPQGAATTVWTAVIADAEAIGGRYCEDCGVAELAGESQPRGGVQRYALDPDSAKALWAKSEEMVGERF